MAAVYALRGGWCGVAWSAQVALGEGDVAGALEHLREAVAAGPNPAARELLGGLLFFDDDLVGALRELELAFREWKQAGEARAAALVAAALADLHSSGFGNRVVGRGWVARAGRLLAPEGRCVELGYVELAVIACETDDVDRLELAAARALELANEFDDSELEVRALADSGYAMVVQGRIAEGFARLDEAMAALSAGEVRNPAVLGMSYCALLAACERVGDVARAEEWTRVVAQTLTEPLGGRPRGMHAHCRLVYGSVLCTAGRWPEGEAALLEVLGPNGTVFLAHHAEATARLDTSLAQAEMLGDLGDGHVEQVVQHHDLTLTAGQSAQRSIDIDRHRFNRWYRPLVVSAVMNFAAELAPAAAGQVQRSGHYPAVQLVDVVPTFPGPG